MMKLRPEHECQYDVVSLGEVMLRIDPVDVPFEKARTTKIQTNDMSRVNEHMCFLWPLLLSLAKQPRPSIFSETVYHT